MSKKNFQKRKTSLKIKELLVAKAGRIKNTINKMSVLVYNP
jgi:catalase (peroxidase I)